MQFELGSMFARPYRPPLYNLRWSAVLAGLVVATAADVLLLLVGAAAGLAMANAGLTAPRGDVLTAVNLWNVLCMIAASMAGGYVAARVSGMRRTPDGVLHGVLAWGVAMLAYVAIAAAAGLMVTESLAPPQPPALAHAPPLGIEERLALADRLERRFGLTTEQANSVVGQALAFAGQAETEARPAMHPAALLRAASAISGWLSAGIVLSLLGAIAGGTLGSRGARRAAGEPSRRGPPEEARELELTE